MRRRQLGWAAAACAFVVALSAPVAGPAHADAESSAGPERACVASIAEGVQSGGQRRAEVADVRCFDTFSAAVAHATDGKVELEPTAQRVDAKQLEAKQAISSAEEQVVGPVLGIEYADTDYGGEVLILSADSGRGCYSGASYTFPDLSAYGFNDKISSAEMFSNCIGKYHAGKNLSGDHRYCDAARCPDFGAMNDRSSSIKFF